MNDLYQRLDKNPDRKVSPRTRDGFVDSPPIDGEGRLESTLPNRHVDVSQPEQTDHLSKSCLVETSKSKLLTLEVKVRQDLDQILFEHQDVSWDTVLEAALITCLNNPTTQKKILKLAAQRLRNRKQSAVFKRTLTMSQKYLSTKT
ncbi:MAG: hypothetical protein RLZZ574_647 [Cyanobacteriota bacterium]|jgi:hypothetical protein